MQQRIKDDCPAVSEDELALVGWFRKLTRNEQEAMRGTFHEERPPVGPAGLEELMRDYAQELRNLAKTRRTMEIYLGDLAKFQRFLNQSEMDITEMGLGMVKEFHQSLVQGGYVRASQSRILTVLKGFCRFLYREGVLGLPQMPQPQAFSVRAPPGLPSYLSQEDAAKLMEIPDTLTPYGLRDRAILELFYSSGLRLAELVDLDLEDINMENLSLFVKHGKGDKQRVGFFGKPCVAAIDRYLNEARPWLLEDQQTGALFLNRYGRRVGGRSVEVMVKRYAKLAGITRPVHPHMLRHSFATHLMENGAGVVQIKELLGHASLHTTQIYTSVTQLEAKRSFMDYHPRSGKED